MAPRIRINASSAVAAVITLFASCLITTARAEIPQVLRGRSIISVEITGEMAGLVPNRIAGIPIGAPLSRPLLRQAAERLLSSGEWVDVQFRVVGRGSGVRVLVNLMPRLLVERYEIRGNRAVDDSEVARVMRLRSGAELNEEDLPEGMARLRAFYETEGYPNAEVELRVRDTDDPARKVVLIIVREGQATRIRAIAFDGDRPPSVRGVMRALGVSVGDVYEAGLLDEGIRHVETYLRERHYYTAWVDTPEVELRDDGVSITLPLELGPEVRLRIRGASPLSNQDIREVLSLDEERLQPGASMLASRRRIVDLYARHGFGDETTVDLDLTETDDTGHAELRVRITPGERQEVEEIVFPGAEFFDHDYLIGQLSSYLDEDLPGGGPIYPVDSDTVGRIGFGDAPGDRRQTIRPVHLDPTRVYYAPTYEEAIRHMRELYQAQGFLDAEVGPARVEVIRRGALRVFVPVREGRRMTIHNVRISGNEQLSTHAIIEATELQRGSAYSALALEEARRSILELYREEGFIFAEVTSEVTFSGDRTRSLIHIQCRERYPVHIGEITIRGAEHTNEALILRTLPFESGELYRPSLARAGESRLMALGIFTSVTISPREPDLPARTKGVVITVSERTSQFLGFSVGVSTGEGIRGGLEYGYRNLFGYAVGLNLRAQVAQQLFFLDTALADRYTELSLADRLERRITAGISVPRLNQLQTSLDLTHLRENERDFGLDANRIALSFGYQPHRRVSFSLVQTLENNDVAILGEDDYEAVLERADPRLQELLRVPQGETTLVATRFDLTVDFRNNPFVPTRGAFLAFSSEYARTLSAERIDIADIENEFFSHQVRLSFTLNGYIPLGRRFVLATQIRYGRIFHLSDDSETYPDRQFFLGGVDSLRAFGQDALLPQDVADSLADTPDFVSSVLRGGDAFVLGRAELRFPLAADIRGGLFVDVGNVWTQASHVDITSLRPTAGLGIRITTPIGPLAFDYGFNVLRRENLNEPFGTFHFSIGLF